MALKMEVYPFITGSISVCKRKYIRFQSPLFLEGDAVPDVALGSSWATLGIFPFAARRARVFLRFTRRVSRPRPRHVRSLPATCRVRTGNTSRPLAFSPPFPALYILYKCVSPSHLLSVPLRAFPVTPCFPAPVQKSSLSHEKNPPFCLAFRSKGVLLHPLSARAPRRFGPAAFSPEKSPPIVWRETGKSLTFASAFPFCGGRRSSLKDWTRQTARRRGLLFWGPRVCERSGTSIFGL